MANTNISEIIDRIISDLNQIKSSLGNKPVASNSLPAVKHGCEIGQRGCEVTQMNQTAQDLETLDGLKELLFSDKWPEATNERLIIDPNSDEQKIGRGKGIIELMIDDDLKEKKFLDFGCGEGHCVTAAADHGTIRSVGYDIKQHKTWSKFDLTTNALLTTNYEEVVANGPYDVIIMFDVIDHVQDESALEVLKKAANVLAPNGKIYFRTHPFTSRHATHLYLDKVNKAFVHLVFTPEELRQILPETKYEEANIGIIYPLKTYGDMITAAGLKEFSRRENIHLVEPFFKSPKISQRICKNLKVDKLPEFQMTLVFIDYILKKT